MFESCRAHSVPRSAAHSGLAISDVVGARGDGGDLAARPGTRVSEADLRAVRRSLR